MNFYSTGFIASLRVLFKAFLKPFSSYSLFYWTILVVLFTSFRKLLYFKSKHLICIYAFYPLGHGDILVEFNILQELFREYTILYIPERATGYLEGKGL